MRNNLVLRFECAKCGRLLTLVEQSDRKYHATDTDRPHLPTGATLLNAGIIKVEPCQNCVEPSRRHARQLADALNHFAEPHRTHPASETIPASPSGGTE